MTASAFAMAGINHIYEGLLDTDPITREPYAGARHGAADGPRTPPPGSSPCATGAKWHDGKPVTADDVVFTFERILDPEANVLVGNFFAVLAARRSRRSTTRTVELVFKFAFPDAAPRLTIAKIMPKHVFGQPGAWDQAKGGKAVGSGPYKQVRAQPQVQHHLRGVRGLQRAAPGRGSRR